MEDLSEKSRKNKYNYEMSDYNNDSKESKKYENIKDINLIQKKNKKLNKKKDYNKDSPKFLKESFLNVTKGDKNYDGDYDDSDS